MCSYQLNIQIAFYITIEFAMNLIVLSFFFFFYEDSCFSPDTNSSHGKKGDPAAQAWPIPLPSRARNLRRSYITQGFVFIGQLLNQPLQGSPLRERGLTASPCRSAPIGSHINSDSEMSEIPRFFNVSDRFRKRFFGFSMFPTFSLSPSTTPHDDSFGGVIG